jgi:metal-responsive CopG/Arc/MetJ family transcriptional regulator
MKALININEADLKKLDILCVKNGWSRSEGIRKAVSLFLKNLYTNDSKEAFGILKGKKKFTNSKLKKIKEEWDESRF